MWSLIKVSSNLHTTDVFFGCDVITHNMIIRY